MNIKSFNIHIYISCNLQEKEREEKTHFVIELFSVLKRDDEKLNIFYYVAMNQCLLIICFRHFNYLLEFVMKYQHILMKLI